MRKWYHSLPSLAADIALTFGLHFLIPPVAGWIADLSPSDMGRWGDVFSYAALELVLVLVGSLVFFFLFRLVLHRFVRVSHFKKVFKMWIPWLVGLVLAIFFQFVATIVLGLGVAARRNVSSIGWILGLALALGLASGALYYILTLISVPNRARYTPPGRLWIVSVFSRLQPNYPNY